MAESGDMPSSFTLPEDLLEKLSELADLHGESPRDIVIAAVEHFTRIPDERRRAALRATSMRRRG